jgi:RimJ/RimL family protein N-acetyltransferase
MKQLMLEHAWHWADTVWFHIGAQNLRSRRALEKLGGRFSHEQMRGPAGASSLTAFYRIDAPPRHA